MKPIVIVGKGPSAKHVPASDAYCVGAINNATMFCERVDFLFLQDVETLDNMSSEDFTKVDRAIVPAYPYQNHVQSANLNHLALISRMPGISNFTVYSPRLENPALSPVDGLDSFPNCYSGGDTAVAWALKNGFRDFIFVGIDPEGGLHQDVQQAAKPLQTRKEVSIQCPHCSAQFDAVVTMDHASHTLKKPEWFRMQYNSMISKIMKAGGSYQHLGSGTSLPGTELSQAG